MRIHLNLDQTGDGRAYDEAMASRQIPPEGAVQIFTKANGTVSGKAAVLMVIPIRLPDGRLAAYPLEFTAREFCSVGLAVETCHPGTCDRDNPQMLLGAPPIESHYRGVGWGAVVVERAYLVHVEGEDRQVSVAGSAEEAKGVAQLMIDQMLGPDEGRQ